jgi:prepilin-type N-terminal cleavage/methylation domain-containing protein
VTRRLSAHGKHGCDGHRCRGFTLWEMVIVLLVFTITLGVAIPAWVRFGSGEPDRPVDALLSVLRASRRAAIVNGVPVSLTLDTRTWRYRADTLGPGGTGPLAEGRLGLELMSDLETDSLRLHYTFAPSGAVVADTVPVRSRAESFILVVDPWTGVPRADRP